MTLVEFLASLLLSSFPHVEIFLICIILLTPKLVQLQNSINKIFPYCGEPIIKIFPTEENLILGELLASLLLLLFPCIGIFLICIILPSPIKENSTLGKLFTSFSWIIISTHTEQLVTGRKSSNNTDESQWHNQWQSLYTKIDAQVSFDKSAYTQIQNWSIV